MTIDGVLGQVYCARHRAKPVAERVADRVAEALRRAWSRIVLRLAGVR